MIHSPSILKKYLFEINANCMIQLGIEVSHPKFIDKIIYNLSKSIIGLHLKIDHDSNNKICISHTSEDPPIFKIPNQLISGNQSNLEQLTESFISNYSVPPTVRLGSIGYNNNNVILNISHSVGDGRYFQYVIQQLNSYLINENYKSINFDRIPPFPKESIEIFKDAIEKVPDTVSSWWNQSKVNRVYSKKIKNTRTSEKVKCKYITSRMPIEKLKAYSNLNGVHGITNSLITSLYIASNVHNLSNSLKLKYDDFVSMPVCVDLRRYMKPSEIDYSICNNFSNVTPYSKVSPNDSIEIIGKRIKTDMFRLMNEKRDIGNLKTYLNLDFSKNRNLKLDPKNGCLVELTYVGPLSFKDPITNIWAGHSMNVRSSTVSLMGFGIDQLNGRKEIVTRLRFPPNVFDDKEAVNMSKSIEFCLTNLPHDLSIHESIEKVLDFQRKNSQ